MLDRDATPRPDGGADDHEVAPVPASEPAPSPEPTALPASAEPIADGGAPGSDAIPVPAVEDAPDAIPAASAPVVEATPGDDPEERLREERLTSLFEAAVYGADGERIGKVGQVYLDDQTQEPNWVTVKTGLFGTKEYFVPLDEAELDGRRLTVPYSKALVTSAPSTEIDQNLSPAEEDGLYRYYAVPGRAPAEAGEERPAGAEPTTTTTTTKEPDMTADRDPHEGTASDADFVADVRAEHDAGDDRVAGEGAAGHPVESGAPADEAPAGGDPAERAAETARASGDDERELGTERVHDESRGGTLDGDGEQRSESAASERVRDDFAREATAERTDGRTGEEIDAERRSASSELGYDGMPKTRDRVVELDAFRRPAASSAADGTADAEATSPGASDRAGGATAEAGGASDDGQDAPRV